MDFSKAFDKVGHTRLTNKLQHYGISGRTLTWIHQFLTGRRQRVVLDGETSDQVPVTSGVPQGSVLGPILYTLYTTPLANIIKNHNLNYHMYADDTQLYISLEPSNSSDLDTSVENCIKDIKT